MDKIVTIYDDNVMEKKSSNIARAVYVPHHEALTVTFKNGGEYRYDRVPASVADSMSLASSVGSYFHHCIRDNYPCTDLV